MNSIRNMMYLRLLSLVSLYFFSFTLHAQEVVKKYVQSNTISISSLVLGDSNLQEFDAIGKAIGDARIVMLGEQDHGDAPTFTAKNKMIKYLHEKKGFNVLAFEADFFSVNYNWKFVQSGDLSVADLSVKNISGVWSFCTACHPLFKEYLPSTQKSGNPLQITGFDNQISTNYFLPLFDSVIRQYKLPITQYADYALKVYPMLTSWSEFYNDSVSNDKVVAYCNEIKLQLLVFLPKSDFWIQSLENFIQLNRQFRNWKKDFWKDMNIRDAQMADNLKWLIENKFPNQKIIVWAHSYHIAKYAGNYVDRWANKAVPMGEIFTRNEEFKNETYILGFSSYLGTAGRLKTPIYKVDKPRKNSFENWMDKSYKYAFVDFKEFNKGNSPVSEKFYMSGATLGNNKYHSNYLAEWNKIFDGVFFIRDMYPCER